MSNILKNKDSSLAIALNDYYKKYEDYFIERKKEQQEKTENKKIVKQDINLETNLDTQEISYTQLDNDNWQIESN
jgi:hypothetical protein